MQRAAGRVPRSPCAHHKAAQRQERATLTSTRTAAWDSGQQVARAVVGAGEGTHGMGRVLTAAPSRSLLHQFISIQGG